MVGQFVWCLNLQVLKPPDAPLTLLDNSMMPSLPLMPATAVASPAPPLLKAHAPLSSSITHISSSPVRLVAPTRAHGVSLFFLTYLWRVCSTCLYQYGAHRKLRTTWALAHTFSSGALAPVLYSLCTQASWLLNSQGSTCLCRPPHHRVARITDIYASCLGFVWVQGIQTQVLVRHTLLFIPTELSPQPRFDVLQHR